MVVAVLTQLLASVTVKLYVVVEEGVATGLEIAGLLSPEEGDQVYV